MLVFPLRLVLGLYMVLCCSGFLLCLDPSFFKLIAKLLIVYGIACCSSCDQFRSAVRALCALCSIVDFHFRPASRAFHGNLAHDDPSLPFSWNTRSAGNSQYWFECQKSFLHMTYHN